MSVVQDLVCVRGSRPPRGTSTTIQRPRLALDLPRLRGIPVTHVRAPAGFGKTILLSHWFAALRDAGEHAVWLTVDRYDEDVITTLLRAISRAIPDLRHEIETMLEDRGFRSTRAELDSLLAALDAFDRDVFILLDDAEAMTTKDLANLDGLIAWMPANLHVIIASRCDLPLGLAGLRSRGELWEIGSRTLRFSPEEVASAVCAAGLPELAQQDVAALCRRVEGWASGLRLAILAMQKVGDARGVIASFSGDQRIVADFFSEVVFSGQPEVLRTFLLRTSGFDRFTAEMCNEILGIDNAHAMIAQIEAAGLFLVPLDDRGFMFRYHGLFADFLARRLSDRDPAAMTASRLAASRWFEAQGQARLALEHALLADDPERIAEVLERHCEDMTYETGMTDLANYARTRLPAEVLARHPRILMLVAWSDAREMNFDSAARRLEQAQALIETMPDGSARDALRRTMAHRQLTVNAGRDEMEPVLTASRDLLRDDADMHPYLACTLLGQTIRAMRETFRFDEVETLEARGAVLLERTGYKFAYVAFQSIVGRTALATGRIPAARRTLEHGLQQAISFRGAGSPLAALPALPLAELLYECGDLDAAEQLVTAHLPAARTYCYADELISGHTTLARLVAARGEAERAVDLLNDLHGLGLAVANRRMQRAALADQVCILLNAGHLDRACRIAAQHGLPEDGAALLPKSDGDTTRMSDALSWTRLALRQGDTDGAMRVARRWQHFCQVRRAIRSRLTWQMTIAAIQQAEGNLRPAQRSLREAVAGLAEHGLVRPLIDEGSHMIDLLASGFSAGPATGDATEMFAHRLLRDHAPHSALQPQEDAETVGEDYVGTLTRREAEVLGMVAAGLRNQEIGTRLGLTEGSVKWYMQQIFDKLGARRRSIAVDRARQLGLI